MLLRQQTFLAPLLVLMAPLLVLEEHRVVPKEEQEEEEHLHQVEEAVAFPPQGRQLEQSCLHDSL